MFSLDPFSKLEQCKLQKFSFTFHLAVESMFLEQPTDPSCQVAADVSVFEFGNGGAQLILAPSLLSSPGSFGINTSLHYSMP